jgi:hypothetical protein
MNTSTEYKAVAVITRTRRELLIVVCSIAALGMVRFA